MFNSREIARRALIRAEEINVYRKFATKRIKATLILGMCAAGAVIAITLLTGPGSDGNTTMISDARVPLARLSSGNPPAYYLPGYDTISIAADDPETDMLLPNPEGNHHLLTFEIVLKDTGETLYLSNLVEPSDHIDGVTLARALAKGRYEAELVIRAYVRGSPAEVNTISMALVIEAE